MKTRNASVNQPCVEYLNVSFKGGGSYHNLSNCNQTQSDVSSAAGSEETFLGPGGTPRWWHQLLGIIAMLSSTGCGDWMRHEEVIQGDIGTTTQRLFHSGSKLAAHGIIEYSLFPLSPRHNAGLKKKLPLNWEEKRNVKLQWSIYIKPSDMICRVHGFIVFMRQIFFFGDRKSLKDCKHWTTPFVFVWQQFSGSGLLKDQSDAFHHLFISLLLLPAPPQVYRIRTAIRMDA